MCKCNKKKTKNVESYSMLPSFSMTVSFPVLRYKPTLHLSSAANCNLLHKAQQLSR